MIITELPRTERIILAVLALGALLGAAMIAYETIDAWKNTPAAEQKPIISKEIGETTARHFLEETFKKDLSQFDVTTSLIQTTAGLSFLDQSALTDDEVLSYPERFLPTPVGYQVRFFKEFEIEEYVVTIDAYRNGVIDFFQIVPEDAVRSDLSREDARARALDFVASTPSLETYTVSDLDTQETTLPGGKEYIFTFKIDGSEIPSAYGEGYTRLTVILQGDTVSGFYRDLFIPETFERSVTQESTVGELLGMLSWLAWLLMGIASFVVMIKAFIAHTAKWKFALVTSAILFGLLIIEIVNGSPTFFEWYTTDVSYSVFTVTTIVLMLFFAIVTIITFITPAIAGITTAFTEHRARLEPLTELPKPGPSIRAYTLAVVRGYLLGITLLGLTYALYWFGEEYLGVWYDFSADMVDPTLLNVIPEFSAMLSLGFMAAITEEVLFRLFGILFFRKIFNSTVVALIVATLVWAFAHSDGTVFPYWFRGLEVFITGILFAYFFIRYNILTTIVAHYVHNAILGALSIVLMLGPSHIVPSVIMVCVPIILLFGTYLYTRSRSETAPQTTDA